MNSESELNIAQWKQLHVEGYFQNHPCYEGGTRDTGPSDVANFEVAHRRPLNPDGVLAIIGCGYGRESKHFVGRVKTVYGIDVSPIALVQAKRFVASPSFVPVLAEEYKTVVPDVDYVYSHSVFQHIPHELTIDYIETFKTKLKPGGAMFLQFVEHKCPDIPIAKPEPVYSWTRPQLTALFGARATIHTAQYKKSQCHIVYWPDDHLA